MVEKHYDYGFIHGFDKYCYETVNLSNQNVTCISKNLIYQIYCSECKFSYNGETCRKLKQRLSEHLHDIKERKVNKLLVNHFTQIHSVNNLRIRVVQKLHNDCDRITRVHTENFWIHQLMTISPFGLNDKVIGMEGMATDMSINKKNNLVHYFSCPLPNTKSRNRNNANKIKPNTAERDINPMEKDTKNLIAIFKNTKKGNIDNLRNTLIENNDNHIEILAINILAEINKKNKIVKNPEKIPLYIKVNFPNIALDEIGIKNLIQDSKIKKLLHLTESKYKVIITYETENLGN